MNKNIIKLIFFISVLLHILSGCKTAKHILEAKQRFIKNEKMRIESNKSVTQLIIKNDRRGNKIGILTSPFLHWAKIKGNIVEEKNKIIFKINSIEFLANWPNGWTFGINDAAGEYVFTKNGLFWELEIIEAFDMFELQKGEIRYFDDYYRKEEGFTKVKNRITRIKAITKFLKNQDLPEFFGHLNYKTSYSSSFKKRINKILFNRKTEYPDHLVKLYQSGTIKRDFEESAGLILMYYNMDIYFNKILTNSIFVEK